MIAPTNLIFPRLVLGLQGSNGVNGFGTGQSIGWVNEVKPNIDMRTNPGVGVRKLTPMAYHSSGRGRR